MFEILENEMKEDNYVLSLDYKYKHTVKLKIYLFAH